MTISIQSTSDTPEAVTAAMGDLAAKNDAVETKAEAAPAESEAEDTREATEEVSAEAAEPEESESEETEEEEGEEQEAKPKKKGGFQKRIDKMSKKLSLAEQEREYWREQALRTQKPEAKPVAVETKPETTGRPQPEHFNSHDEYLDAVIDWKADQKLSEREQKQKAEAAKSEAQTKIEKHKERVTKFAESRDDWEDVIQSVGSVPLSLTVQEAIVDSDLGPELMYELAKDPKELDRICRLAPIQAAKELGKLEARLTKSSTVEEKKTTKAPSPVNPVRTRGASTAKSVYDPDLSQKEYERLRNEQLKNRQL